MECEKCGTEMTTDKFSDAVCKDGRYFDVYVCSCPACGFVDDSATFVD